MHTTILLQSNNEILSFETFSIGTEELMKILLEKYENYSPIQIENMLYGEYNPEIEWVLRGYLWYFVDILLGYISLNESNGDFRKVFCHGWIFQNPKIHQLFRTLINDQSGDSMQVHRIIDILPEWIPPEWAIVHGLSYMANELLHVKKDPLIRILRYVLYNYE